MQKCLFLSIYNAQYFIFINKFNVKFLRGLVLNICFVKIKLLTFGRICCHVCFVVVLLLYFVNNIGYLFKYLLI